MIFTLSVTPPFPPSPAIQTQIETMIMTDNFFSSLMRIPPHTDFAIFSTDSFNNLVNRCVLILPFFSGHHHLTGDEKHEEYRSAALSCAIVPPAAAPGLRGGPVVLKRRGTPNTPTMSRCEGVAQRREPTTLQP